MALKRAITALLVLFAVGSALYVVLGESASLRGSTPNPGGTPAHGQSATVVDGTATVPPDLIVYYMDMGKDCTTCLNLESYTHAALETWFQDDLASGRIAWRVVDVDVPENEHFVNEFGLYTKSVVLVRPEDDGQDVYESLSRIWELVYDKEAYMTYIREQVQAFLETHEAPA